MRRYEIRIDGEFSAAHQLRLYDGSLEPLHGHNWQVEVYITSEQLDSMGVVADFHVIKKLLDEQLARWHDRFLNQQPEFQDRNPSTEAVAEALFDSLKTVLPKGMKLRRLRVWETRDCAAACEESD